MCTCMCTCTHTNAMGTDCRFQLPESVPMALAAYTSVDDFREQTEDYHGRLTLCLSLLLLVCVVLTEPT